MFDRIRRGVLLFLLVIVVLVCADVVWRRLTLNAEMRAFNQRIGLSETPPFFARPPYYYRDHFLAKLPPGMSRTEVRAYLEGVGAREIGNRRRSPHEYSEGFLLRFTSTLPVDECDHVYVHITYHDDAVTAVCIDNS